MSTLTTGKKRREENTQECPSSLEIHATHLRLIKELDHVCPDIVIGLQLRSLVAPVSPDDMDDPVLKEWCDFCAGVAVDVVADKNRVGIRGKVGHPDRI